MSVACRNIDRFAYLSLLDGDAETFLHRLTDDEQRQGGPVTDRYESWPGTGRHAIYARLLQSLTLSAHHEQFLRRIGIGEDAVGDYGTAPDLRAMARHCEDIAARSSFSLLNIPGFQRRGPGITLDGIEGELLVPIRDHLSRVVAIQRYALGGDSARTVAVIGADAAAIHCARAWTVEATGRMLITGDVLRADVLAERLKTAACAILAPPRQYIGGELRERFPLRELAIDPTMADRDRIAGWMRDAHIAVEVWPE